MMTTSTASTYRHVAPPETSIEGDVFKLRVTGDASQLKAVISILNNCGTEHPFVGKIELDVTEITGQKTENLVPVLASLLRWGRNRAKPSSQVTGLSGALLMHSTIKSFSKTISLIGGACINDPIPNRALPHQNLQKSLSSAKENFSTKRNCNAVTLAFTESEISYVDLEMAKNALSDSDSNVTLDLTACKTMKRDAAIALSLISSNLSHTREQLTILVKSKSEPDNQIIRLCETPAYRNLFGDIVRVPDQHS